MEKDKGEALLDTYVKLEIRKSHHRLIKFYLRILEDIRDNRFSITEETFTFLRKKTLDQVNEETRTLEESFDMEKFSKILNISKK